MAASLVVTIDTEPDNQWAAAGPGGRLPDLSFENTRGLARLIDALRRWGARATWFTSYSVARDAESVRQLKRAAAGGDEIGCHLHAWETPPFAPTDGAAHSYIYEYEPEVRLAKLKSVTSALEDSFGARPVSYRAGRWGIDELEYRHLERLGYKIDSSVVPGYDFRGALGRERGGPDFRALLTRAIPEPYRVGGLWEVPASATTAGGALGARASAFFARHLATRRDPPSRVARKALSVLGVSRLVWLRPFWHPREDLIRAALAMVDEGASVINVMFHSSETMAGGSPSTPTQERVERLYADLEALIGSLLSTKKVVARTLREALGA